MALNFKRCEELAHLRGQGCAQRMRAMLYGSRYAPETNAGTAPDRGNIGIGRHSVWQGPQQIHDGAPVLKRDRSA